MERIQILLHFPRTCAKSPPPSSSAMAFLFRLRTIHTLTNPSLLRHHYRLFSTSNSAPYFLCKKQYQFLTLTNPSPPLLRHHRLLSTSTSGATVDVDPNSIHLSPSSLRELRDAIKQLSSSTSNPTSATSYPPPSVISNFDPSSDSKFDQLKESALSLKHRQDVDRQRISNLITSKNASLQKIKDDLAEFFKLYEELKRLLAVYLPQNRETIGNELETLFTRLKEMEKKTVEVIELSQELTNSRLVSIYEIEKNLSQIREDLPHEVWNELNEELARCNEMEHSDFQSLADETNLQLAFIKEHTEFDSKLGKMRRTNNHLG